MITWLVKKILGTKNQREVRKLFPLVAKINEIETTYQSLSDDQLRAKTEEFKQRYQNGETLHVLLPEAFAVVKNACRRFTQTKRRIQVRGQEIVWEMIPFDVQLLGGIVLHQGKIAEMATGEGKTLVATLPTYLNALTSLGVHVITVNDYLAQRDSEWMGEIYRFLGLTVGCIQHDMSSEERREQYACDITYGTNTEFGFDYLRDNGMASRAEDQVQRGHYYAIVDEVDSILIDEARTPLIISGPVTVASNHQFEKLKPAIERLVREQNTLCNRFAGEAKAAFEKGDIAAAGAALYRVRIGTPNNKQLLKMLEEPELRRALEDFETNLYADTRREELYRIKEELFFTIDAKNNDSDLSTKGRTFLSPNDPDAFVVPDLLTQMHDINSDPNKDRAAKDKLIHETQNHFDQSTDRIHTISQLLRAYCTMEKDVQYVVQDNKVMIVDEFTGRVLPGRRWSDGLHQAVEAKEGVRIDRETQTLATITIQNYFRLYQKLAGMTGTAETEANEFHDIYKLSVVVIPSNRVCIRKDANDSIYKTRREKYNAIIKEIKESYARKQPLLIGTISVEASELLSRMLKRENIIHNVLNAKFHQQEAEIVARAGQAGAVTIATNMAGRGTDIKLGSGVADLGGLKVIATERHEARRIDRQLRGRCARQGDPGASKFFVSFEDDLMRNFADSRKLALWMTKLGMKDDEELNHPWLNKSVESAQKRVEQRNYTIRKHTLQYDDVMNQQRTIVYDFRNEILHASNPRQQVFEVIEEIIKNRVEQKFSDSETGTENFLEWVNRTFPINLSLQQLNTFSNADALSKYCLEQIEKSYALKTQFEEAQATRTLERYMILSALDRLWQEHLYAMDGLRTSIGLRAYGQKDPLLEYKQEAFSMFEEMMREMKEEIASNLFRSTASLTAFEQFLSALPQRFVHEESSALGGSSTANPNIETAKSSDVVSETIAQIAQPVRRSIPKVGRNDPCPCGSGKKYKNCCGV